MGLFGEKYSKEGFEAAKEASDNAKKSYEQVGSLSSNESYMTPEHRQGIYDERASAANKATRKVEKIYASGQKEAIELNQKYEQLKENARKAQEELHKFEQNELGMSENKG